MSDFETIPEDSMKWLNKQALDNELDVDELCRKFLDIEKELRETASLRKEDEDPENGFDDEDYYEFIETNVNSYIISVKGSPTAELEVFVIGIYAPQSLNNGSMKMDMMGWCYNPENPASDVEPVKITAWNEQVQRAHAFRQFGCYRTKFGFDPEQKRAGKYEIEVKEATSFEEAETFSWMGGADTDKDRYKLAIGTYTEKMPLGEINKPSALSCLADAGNGKSYTDVTDIRRIKGKITRYSEDAQGEYFTFGIVDKTFNITGKNKDFSIWANPSIASELGIGEGSNVEFFGSVRWNKKNNVAQMDACTIIPKLIVPPASAKGKIRTGGAVDPEATPKKLNLNINSMEG